MTPDEMKDEVFVSQMETTDADIAIFMKQNGWEMCGWTTML